MSDIQGKCRISSANRARREALIIEAGKQIEAEDVRAEDDAVVGDAMREMDVPEGFGLEDIGAK